MSTETKKLMITPGKAFLDEGVTGALVVVEDKNLADFFSLEEEHWANAELYMLAHNVYNQTGLSPLELVEKLKEAESHLKHALQHEELRASAKLRAADLPEANTDPYLPDWAAGIKHFLSTVKLPNP